MSTIDSNPSQPEGISLKDFTNMRFDAQARESALQAKLVDARFAAVQQLVDLRFEASQVLVSKTEVGLNAHLALLNGWKEYSQGRDALFVTHTEHDFVIKRIDELKSAADKSEGAATRSDLSKVNNIAIAGCILAAVAIVVGIVEVAVLFFKK